MGGKVGKIGQLQCRGQLKGVGFITEMRAGVQEDDTEKQV